jgi:cobalamin-dependent methionine synthase I
LYQHFDVLALHHERLRLEGKRILSGRLLAEHLAAATQVIVSICTIGDALEGAVSEVMAEDPVRGLALDGLGNAAVEALANAVFSQFEEQAENSGMLTTIPLSPGMVGWPVEEGQQQIFSLIEAEVIGVKLTDSSLMHPRKSVSMVMGIGKELASKGRTCDLCSLKETCRYQDHYH